MGVRKDLIVVVGSDGSKTPLFDWCRERQVTVVCNRCGQDITYEVDLKWCKRVYRESLDLPKSTLAKKRQFN